MKNKIILLWKKNKNIIYSGLIGLGIGIFITLSFFPERIAVLQDGTQVVATTNYNTITADNLYESMKDEYAISALLNEIDKQILENTYTVTEEMQKEINDTAQYYINMYETYYDFSKEEFLTNNGFETENDFLEYLTIDYLRNVYYEEYLKKQIDDKDIKNYYKKSVYGAIETKYIAIDINMDNSETIIKEILEKLKNGSSYEEIINIYEEKITYQDLGYLSWNANIDEVYLTKLQELKNNTYSKEYISTNFGYTIIFRGEQQDKKDLEEEKENIIEKLAIKLKESDENLYYKALIKLRNDNNLEFLDTDLKTKYKAYCKQFD